MQYIYINKTINKLFLAHNYLIKIVNKDANWFNDHVTQYVSHSYAGRNNGSHIGFSSGTTNDSNADDDGDNDDSNEDDDDDVGDLFWHIKFDCRKLAL